MSDLIVLKSPELRLWDFPIVAKLVLRIAGSRLPALDLVHPQVKAGGSKPNYVYSSKPRVFFKLDF